jgi:hypothetical protein
MRNTSTLIAVAALQLAGCTAAQLAHNTVTQAHSHTDILYRQVLDNLAAAECNPDVLPHFSVVGTGGTTVIDAASANVGFDWDARTFLGTSLGLGGAREFEDGWTLAPTVNPDKLRAMRAAYQIVTRGQAADPAGFALLESYLGPEYMSLLQQGWYGVGSKHDVPKRACYVSHCGDRYVWVTGDGLAGLSQLSLAILNVATIKDGGAPVRIAEPAYKGAEHLSEPWESYEYVPRARENYYNPLQSQIQMMGR